MNGSHSRVPESDLWTPSIFTLARTGSALLDGDLADVAGEGRAAFERADEPRRSGDRAAIDRDGIEQCRALLGNARADAARVDFDGVGGFRKLDRRSGRGGRSRREAEFAGCVRDGSESGPLDGAIGPIG